MILKGNAPCTCTHSYSNHVIANSLGAKSYGCAVRRCACDMFKLDNLKYLEKENESRQQQLH